MFLKRLDLQGFKTFASRTEIEFSGGLTCVVGPNGSGKSNLADAMRWVLGEQSLRALRCKRTEDVIFAGGAGRPPAGMTEVSIAFDNATGWLDTPFQEVVVTRRAYRSGENEYLINRDRVRLRDLLDLLLKANVSPNGYTVIGQGMVDLALSLKPEERRELFEDAAGIRHHYVRLNEARSRLGTTEANLSRVRDVIAEIEPRLKQLERRARQLREREGVRAELRAHLAAWYGHRWLTLRAEADAAELRECETAGALASARASAEATAEEAAELTRRQAGRRARLDEIELARQELIGQGERLARELALRRERASSARARAAELRGEVEEMEARLRADAAAVEAARLQIARLESDVAGLAAALEAAEGETEGHRRVSDGLRQQLARAEAVAQRFQQEQAALEAELAQLAPRRDELRAEAARAADAAARDEERVLAAQAALDRERAALVERQRALELGERAAERLREELAASRRAQEAIALRIAEAARERATVQGRLDLLQDLREGYAGYYQGVRAVLAAARSPAPDAGDPEGRPEVRRRGDAENARLEGVIGLVASLVRVPAELELAIEVALGSHLQDIVVERWEHAEAAIELLKRTRAGRATFLPLDTVRPPPSPAAPDAGTRGAPPPSLAPSPCPSPSGRGDAGAASALTSDAFSAFPRPRASGRPSGSPASGGQGGGVRGLATALVEFEPRYRGVIEQVLGHTLIVDDLPTARRCQREIGGSWQMVTVAGEVVRASGAITGGSSQPAGDRTLLARERERRELPERLAAVAASGRSLEAELAAERARQAGIETEQRRLQIEQRQAGEAVARAREGIAAAAGRIERLRREVEWSRESADRAAAELAALDRREAALRARLTEVPAVGVEHLRLVERLQLRLVDFEAATRAQAERVMAFRNNVAVIEGERRAQTRLLEGHEERRARVGAEIEARHRRVDELGGSAAALDDEAEEIEAAQGALEDQRAALAAEAGPIQAEIARLREQVRLIQSGEAAGRAQLNQLADAVRAVAIQAQSARNQLEALVREAIAELRDLSGDVDDPSTAEAPDDLIYEPLVDPGATWRRIEQLRARMRAIGAVDASAGQEYDQTLARHAFLSGQAGDLVEASRLLKGAILELETTMQERFAATFAAVAEAFRRHFTALFGGGTARLVLAEEEGGGVPGVEIIAQPPGKRAQSLSLLSGGERALTAVAILFAILEVSPTPVCLLDEVDAALDDANIVRFARTLRQLAERTQFVVITHNRGTMEAADALYGVSMVDRSTSRTMSLRLTDVPG
ncbi:MAG TPA: AAA family ATPase [Chloroflexota bacterium]